MHATSDRPEPPGPSTDPGSILARVFGFHEFRPGQKEVLNHLIAGRHVLALVPTGGGKSLTYQMAALCRPGLGLVISPLKALMQDQVRRLSALGVPAATVQSGTSMAEKRAVWDAIKAARLKLLYVSPEQLLKEDGRLLGALARLELSVVAVDEAHTVSQWGHDFRAAYRELGSVRQHVAGTPIVALTATADEVTQRDIMDVLFGGPVPVVKQSFDRPNLRLRVLTREQPEAQLIRLVQDRQGEGGIVYVRTRDQADATAAALRASGLPAMGYHAGLDERTRNDVMHRFVEDPAPLIVATVAFGMGVDRPDLRFVLHRDLPATPEAYYQEIGRAGRDGLPADAVLLWDIADLPRRRRMIDASEAAPEFKRLQHRRLESLVAVALATSCRKQALLRYFGEEVAPCGRCDVCTDPPELADATESALLLFQAIAATGERFGRAHVIDVLRGAVTAKVREHRHDRLKLYGAGRDLAPAAWQALVRQLVAGGRLEIDLERHGALRPTRAAGAISAGRERVCADLRVRERERSRIRQPSARAELDPTSPAALLFQRLKSLRAEIARSHGWPAYLVFNDKALLEMARLRPTSPRELAAIDGVGAKKLESFGQAFLQAIAAAPE